MSLTSELIRKAIQTRDSDMLKNTVNILHPDEKYSKYVIMEYDGNVPRLFGDKRSIELLIPKDIDVVTENAVVDAIESGSLFDDKKDIENKVDYITMTHVPTLGMMHRHMDEPHGLHHAVGMVIGAMHPDDGHFGSTDADMINGKNFTSDLTKHGDEKDTSVLDLTSDYLDIKDKMGKGCPVELRRSLKDIPDEVSNIKKVKPEDTVDEKDYEEIGLDHEDEDEDYEEEDEKDSDKKEDDDEADYADEDDEREHSIEKFLKNRKKKNDKKVEIEEESDFQGESAELSIKSAPKSTSTASITPVSSPITTNTTSSKSSYDKSPIAQSLQSHQLNKPVKKSSYQESYEYNEQDIFNESNAILMKPKSLKPIKREVVTYILTQKNNIHDANDQSMLASYACAKLELVDFYLNCIDTHDYRYIVPHNRQYLVQMQNDLNRALQEVLRVKPVNRMDRPWHVNVTYPQGWGG